MATKRVKARGKDLTVRGNARPTQSSLSDKARGLFRRRSFYVAAVAAALVLFALWWLIGGGSTLGARVGMSNYLKSKYNEDFLVKDIQYAGGLGVDGMWQATASPVANQSLEFRVVNYEKSKQFGDQYAGAIWEREEYRKVEQYVDSLKDPNISNFRVKMGTNDNGIFPVEGGVPSFDEAVKTHESIINYQISVLAGVDDLTDFAKEFYRDRTRSLVSYVESRGMSHALGISYTLRVGPQDDEYTCALSGLLADFEVQIENCFNVKSTRKAW